MASLSQLIPIPLIVFEVEALTARRGVELALELGFNSVELEGDLAVLISALNVCILSLDQNTILLSIYISKRVLNQDNRQVVNAL